MRQFVKRRGQYLDRHRPRVLTVLEGESSSQLDDAIGSSSGDLANVRGRQCCIRRVQADQVEHVSRVSPELKGHRLPDVEVTLQAHIDITVSRCA